MGIRSRIVDAIARWYHGTHIPYVDPPDSGMFGQGGYYKHHWTARRARSVVRFHILYGGILWTIVIAVLFAYLAVRAFE